MTIAEQLAEILRKNGVDVADVVAASAKMVSPKTRKPSRSGVKRPSRKTKTTFNSSVAAATAKPTKRGRGKYAYGTAPTIKGDPRATHVARIEALEALIPGISTEAYIFTVGKNAKNKPEKHLNLIVNDPWTWIELPAGKAQSVGTMKPDAVRAKLAEAGYGFSPSNNLWATDSKGNPTRRRAHYRAMRVGAALLNEDD